MKNDFTTAPLAPGLIHLAGGGTVEKSLYSSHTKIQTLPAAPSPSSILLLFRGEPTMLFA